LRRDPSTFRAASLPTFTPRVTRSLQEWYKKNAYRGLRAYDELRLTAHSVGDNTETDMDLLHTLHNRWYFDIWIYLFLGLVLFTIFRLLESPKGSKLPTINDRGLLELTDKRVKQNFVLNGGQLLREGLEKFNGRPFKILTDRGPTIILSPQYTEEIRNNASLSHAKAIAKVCYYSPRMILQSTLMGQRS